jgi:hypothetical protein|tara:strand:+ start:10363 stop:10647 length:285 start_codon:yes stop_codon:yes gene_type:complete
MIDIDKTIEQKGKDYGNPLSFFSSLAVIYSQMIGKTISTNQVIAMFMVMKSLRAYNNPDHQDSFLDAMGYSKIGLDIAKEIAKIDKAWKDDGII